MNELNAPVEPMENAQPEKSPRIIHYPTLKTIFMVENVLKNANVPLNKSQIKKNLPVDIMHQTLNLILSYLEESNKIIKSSKNFEWKKI